MRGIFIKLKVKKNKKRIKSLCDDDDDDDVCLFLLLVEYPLYILTCSQ